MFPTVPAGLRPEGGLQLSLGLCPAPTSRTCLGQKCPPRPGRALTSGALACIKHSKQDGVCLDPDRPREHVKRPLYFVPLDFLLPVGPSEARPGPPSHPGGEDGQVP